jgi:UDP-glucose 4-epimerase
MINQLKNSKILVTGGAGFIGSHLTDKFLELGYHVSVLDNLSNGKLENLENAHKFPNFHFIHGDILDKETCINATKGIQIIFHLACLGVRHSIHSPFENHRVNAEGTLNVLEAARLNNISKFYYISTSEIYGDIKQFPIDENGVPLPKTVYGSSKLAGENYAYSYHKCFGMNTTILRIFNNYGPRAHYEGDSGEIIPRTIVNVLNGISPVIFGDGSITRDFFFVKDTAQVLVDLIQCNGLEGKTFNIGTGIEITMKYLVNKIISFIPEQNTSIEFLPDRPADVPRLWVNSSKIRSILEKINETNFDVGLKETFNFYRELNNRSNLSLGIKKFNWEK